MSRPDQRCAGGIAKVVQASTEDVPGIGSLLEGYAAMGNLLPRTRADIRHHLGEFVVVRDRSAVVACGALEIFTDELAEIRSLAVSYGHAGRGLGSLLIEHLTGTARRRGMRRLMALTYVPDFFHKWGFETVDIDSLPEKVWGICVQCYKARHCDETAMVKQLQKSSGLNY